MPEYSIEFFHIYSDEKIGESHLASIDYLRVLQSAWPSHLDRIILIDDYNADEEVTTYNEILGFLDGEGVSPHYWAYEADLVDNARALLGLIKSPKLQKEYVRYVEKRQKYPCSLLAAAWYLTRLGKFDHSKIIRSAGSHEFAEDFEPADRLINILPQSYKPVEERILKIIASSEFGNSVDLIQDLFYESENGKVRELF